LPTVAFGKPFSVGSSNWGKSDAKSQGCTHGFASYQSKNSSLWHLALYNGSYG